MIEVAIRSVVDRLIQLLNHRGSRREREFEKIIEPLVAEAEPLAKDYMTFVAS